jgi:hypothetical protein
MYKTLSVITQVAQKVTLYCLRKTKKNVSKGKETRRSTHARSCQVALDKVTKSTPLQSAVGYDGISHTLKAVNYAYVYSACLRSVVTV